MQIFRNSELLTLAEIFPKFTRPTTENSHMSDILYKGYMGKTIICHILITNTTLYYAFHTWSPRAHVYMYKSVLDLKILHSI